MPTPGQLCLQHHSNSGSDSDSDSSSDAPQKPLVFRKQSNCPPNPWARLATSDGSISVISEENYGSIQDRAKDVTEQDQADDEPTCCCKIM